MNVYIKVVAFWWTERTIPRSMEKRWTNWSTRQTLDRSDEESSLSWRGWCWAINIWIGVQLVKSLFTDVKQCKYGWKLEKCLSFWVWMLIKHSDTWSFFLHTLFGMYNPAILPIFQRLIYEIQLLQDILAMSSGFLAICQVFPKWAELFSTFLKIL